MPHIEVIKTKNGKAYRVKYSKDGKRYSRYFPVSTSFKDVKLFADTVIANPDPPQLSPVRLGELLAQYMIARQNEHNCWREGVAMRHLVRFAGDVYAHRITSELLHRFRDALFVERKAGRELEYATEQKIKRGVNHDLRHIRIIFRWAYKHGIMSSHPFDRVELFKTAPPRPDVLTAEEMSKLRSVLNKQDRLIFYLLRFTGLRIGEACALKCEDVDLERGVIRLTKTKNREQVDIPLDYRLARIWRWTKHLEEGCFIVPYRSTTTVIHHFRKAMRECGINKAMPTHIFRHTAGRRIIERYFTTGNAQEIARRFLRHKTRVMTDHYTQTYIEDIGRAMSDVDL